jgi:tRNA(fMet)-specific endonuclease VapC
MKYLLDTNVCIVYLNGKSPSLKRRFDAEGDANLAVSSVSKAEMYYGAAKSNSPVLTLQKQQEFLARFCSLVFDDSAAAIYGPVRGNLERSGVSIGAHDLLIAAIAVSQNLILVTYNTGEFRRIPGLQVEDWQTD